MNINQGFLTSKKSLSETQDVLAKTEHWTAREIESTWPGSDFGSFPTKFNHERPWNQCGEWSRLWLIWAKNSVQDADFYEDLDAPVVKKRSSAYDTSDSESEEEIGRVEGQP